MHRRLLPKQKISISPVGVDVHDDPRKIWVRAAHPSVAKKRDLREPSPAGEGGPLAVDEVFVE